MSNYKWFFCNVDRDTQSTQTSTQALRQNKCKNADKTCWKIVQYGLSTVSGWSSTTETLGQVLWLAYLSYRFNCRGGCTKSPMPQWWSMRQSTQRKNHSVGLLLIKQQSKATHIRVESRVCLHSLYRFLNKEVHRHRTVNIESLAM